MGTREEPEKNKRVDDDGDIRQERGRKGRGMRISALCPVELEILQELETYSANKLR